MMDRVGMNDGGSAPSAKCCACCCVPSPAGLWDIPDDVHHGVVAAVSSNFTWAPLASSTAGTTNSTADSGTATPPTVECRFRQLPGENNTLEEYDAARMVT